MSVQTVRYTTVGGWWGEQRHSSLELWRSRRNNNTLTYSKGKEGAQGRAIRETRRGDGRDKQKSDNAKGRKSGVPKV